HMGNRLPSRVRFGYPCHINDVNTSTRLIESPRVDRGRASGKCPRQRGGARRWGMPDKDVSLATRVEITKKYAKAYELASKKNKSQVLDQLVEVTGWNRDHARQQLRRRMRQPNGRAQATVAVLDRRRTRGRKYSY